MLVVSLDPGESSGGAVLRVGDSQPAELLAAYQVDGGVAGFLGLLDTLEEYRGFATWICEKYSPRPSTATGFQQSLKTTLPLVCEGVLIGRDLMPVYSSSEKRYRDPSLQYFSGGTGKAERKKRQHAFLKANGFYRTGKDFGTADADDFRSATAHGINYIARELKHKPTFDMITAWGEEN